MERSRTRRGMATAGLILSWLVAACSAASPASSPDPSEATRSPATSPVALASADPTPAPSPLPTPEPSTEPDDGLPAPDVEADPDDEYAEPGLDACGDGVPTDDGGSVVACREDATRTSVERYGSNGDMAPGWPVILDGGLIWSTWNDFTIGCGRDVGDVARGPGDSVLVAVQVDDAVELHRLGPDGRELPGWPRTLPGDVYQPDGMGAAGCFGYAVSPDEQRVLGWGYEGGSPDMELLADRTEFSMWTLDGKPVPGWPRGSTGAASGPVFDDAGQLTYVSSTGRVWRHARDGDVLPGWGYQLGMKSPPIIGTQNQVGFIQPSFEVADTVLVIGPDGRPASGYPTKVGGEIETRCLFGDTPCIGDVAPTFLMNGTIYIALGNGGEHEVGETGGAGGSIVAFDAGGRVVDGWPVQLPDRTHATRMVVDTTGSLIVEGVTCRSSCMEGSEPVTLYFDMDGRRVGPDGG